MIRLPSWLRRRPPGPADPRARKLIAAAWLLYQELEPGDTIGGVVLITLSGRQMVSYMLHDGDDEIQRTILDLDDPGAVARGEITDATVRDGPP